MNFWHIFDSGSKFEILKPNSSWLTFGISKFVSLSISHFLFFFSSTFFYIVLSYTNIVLSLWLLHLKITTVGYYISKLLPLAITSQNYYLWLYHFKITTFGYYISKLLPSAISFQNYHFWLFHLKIYILFIVSNSTSIPTAMSDTIAVSLKPYSH